MAVLELHRGDGSVGRDVNLTRFLAERQDDWIQLDRLVEQAGPRLDRLTPAEVLQAGRLYRRTAADLALARRQFVGDPLVERLEALVRRSRQLVYGTVSRRDSFARFLSRGYWTRVRERPAVLLVSALLLMGPLLGSGVWAASDPVTATRVSGAALASPDDQASAGVDRGFTIADSAAFSTMIFTNNVQVALIAFAGGITGGIVTAFSLLFNGFSIGVIGGLIIDAGGGDRFFRLVVPHGALELSLIVVAGMAGLRMGLALIRPGHRRRGEALTSEARAAGELALGTALWLIPCGLVEGFVTPQGLSLPAAVAVGVALAGLFWAMVLWRGEPARRRARP
jgi:uncharacterized membrane protein SpoIIM required for sporulation